jgi:type IV secretion system protein VirD4
MNLPRTRDDILLALILAALVLLTAYGAAIWTAATLIVLVHEHRLLDASSPTVLETGIDLIGNLTTPSAAFATSDMLALPRDPYLHLVAAPVLAALGILARLAWLLAHDTLPTSRSKHDSRWATRRDASRIATSLKSASGRLVLGTAHGRTIATEQHHSVVVFGPTGSGKTTGIVIPALLNHHGPAVALSVKSDLVYATHHARAQLGDVHVYDPLGLTNYPSSKWTPLRACRCWEEAQRMAEALTSAVGDSGLAASRFWDAMAAKLLEPMLHAAALDNRTMRDVVAWIDERNTTNVENILEHHDATDALRSFRASQERDDRTKSSVYASAEVILRAYASPRMSDTTPDDSLDPATLLSSATTLYVVAPAEDQARLRPVFSALVKDIYRCAVLKAESSGQPLDPGLLLVLDEAANIAPIHDLAQIAATCRAYAIQLVTIFQDLAQVTHRYQHGASTVVNNHTAKMLLPGASDRELLELVSRLVGEETIARDTTSTGPSGVTHSSHLHQRPLAAIHELRQLTRDQALLLYANLPPLVIRLRPHYTNRSTHKDAA